jgi:His/Glu/Gln/Arg/opine family amino acid ABC transporter permease subunit
MKDLLNPVIQVLPDIGQAMLFTIISALVAMVLAMVLAIPAAFGRLSHSAIIRSIATFYVETIRGTPFLLQLLIWVFGVQTLLVTLFNFNVDIAFYNLLTALNSNSLAPRQSISVIFFAVLGLAFNYGAYLAEVIRAGILAVDQGQTEAAQSLGMSRRQVARFVVLPQALRLMIPPLTNNFITLVQDTAFFQIVGIYDLSLTIQSHAQPTSNTLVRWEFYITELLIYFAICYSLATVSRRLEARGVAPAARRGLFPFRRPAGAVGGVPIVS